MAFILNPNFKRYDKEQKNKLSVSDLEKLALADMRNTDPRKITPLPPPKELPDSVLIKCPGYWWLLSNSDPRWKAEGKSEEVGGRDMCPEAKIAFRKLKEKLGKKTPFDLVYRFEPINLKKFKLADHPDNLSKH